ncbi:hypothetical protein BDV97DRAFT_360892 [Delphinella strobiligena]|nr:hypothetical protein BDV97DRAFT_360892 [Delphinella strobiligena]
MSRLLTILLSLLAGLFRVSRGALLCCSRDSLDRVGISLSLSFPWMRSLLFLLIYIGILDWQDHVNDCTCALRLSVETIELITFALICGPVVGILDSVLVKR